MFSDQLRLEPGADAARISYGRIWTALRVAARGLGGRCARTLLIAVFVFRTAVPCVASPDSELHSGEAWRTLVPGFPVLNRDDFESLIPQTRPDAREAAAAAWRAYSEELSRIDAALTDAMAKLTPRMEELRTKIVNWDQLVRDGGSMSLEEIKAEASRRQADYVEALISEGLRQEEAKQYAKAGREIAAVTSHLIEAVAPLLANQSSQTSPKRHVEAQVFLGARRTGSTLPADFTAIGNLRISLAVLCSSATDTCLWCTRRATISPPDKIESVLAEWEDAVGCHVEQLLAQYAALPGRVNQDEFLRGIPLDGSSKMVGFVRRGEAGRRTETNLTLVASAKIADLLKEECGEALSSKWMDSTREALAPRLLCPPWEVSGVRTRIMAIKDLDEAERAAAIAPLERLIGEDARALRARLFTAGLDQYIEQAGLPAVGAQGDRRAGNVKACRDQLNNLYSETARLVLSHVPVAERSAVARLLGQGGPSVRARLKVPD